MDVKFIPNPAELIIELNSLKEQGYIFRGQPDSQFKLIPSAFRPDIIRKMIDEFSITSEKIREWFFSKQILECIKYQIPHQYKYICKCIENRYPFQRYANMLPIEYQRFFKWHIYIMQYNYGLHKYIRKFPQQVSPDDKALIELRPLEWWASEETFIWLITNAYLPALQMLDLNNEIIKEGFLFEDLTGIDETFPQHYGLPTAALDWSYNPLVAIYFACGIKNVQQSANGLYLTESMHTTADFLSVYAYKALPDIVDPPIKIIEKNHLIHNERANRQEGIFTYFTKPFSFYLQHENFPTVDYYVSRFKNNLDKQSFELIKYNVRCILSNLKFFFDLLSNNGITEEYVLPPFKNLEYKNYGESTTEI